MTWTRDGQLTPNIQQLIERILSAEQLSRQEYFQLMSAALSDYMVNEEQRRQINRIFDEVQTKRLQLVY